MTSSPSALIATLVENGLTIAAAESLTGGLLSATLTEIAGSSAVFRGGVVAYATELKTELLGVDAQLISDRGVVSAEVAESMASGVVRRLTADIGVSTTGVAGPAEQDGIPVGTVFVACSYRGEVTSHQHVFSGTREQIRHSSVHAVLALVEQVLSSRE